MLKENFSPAVVDTLNRTARLLQGADRYIAENVNRLLHTIVYNRSSAQFSLKVSSLLTLDEFIQGELIQLALRTKFNLMPVSLAAIDRALELLDAQPGTQCDINKDIIAVRDRKFIIFTKKNGAFKINQPIEKLGEYRLGDKIIKLQKVNKKEVIFSRDKNVEYFDYDLVPSLLYLRSWEAGDSFQPLGMAGTVKISDFLTNEKAPVFEKQNAILLASKSEILWVCGFRINDKFKITGATRKFLKAELIFNSEE